MMNSHVLIGFGALSVLFAMVSMYRFLHNPSKWWWSLAVLGVVVAMVFHTMSRLIA
jgi:uncharacterized BrkB/YihY/UPF0761 family membrane protein